MSKTQSRQAIEEIPKHLKAYTTEQDYSLYTARDHAGWRFIMKLSEQFFASTAHAKYLDGLKETGITIEQIPDVKVMDEKMKKIGWRAVAVAGFIPPAQFLEFMALGIMPIACEFRKIENLAYTPAPDIVHEAAGHAPIVADDEYNDYVRAYGDVAVKAIFSKKDIDLFVAIRNLSDIKEKPQSTEEEIAQAHKNFEDTYAKLDYLSEATELARMSWWTVEYGLVGSLDNYKIYGAGLLSSLGESYNCLSPKVKKIPFTLDCIKQSYDITKAQPQLFVAPSFGQMRKILEEYAETMAYKLGGMKGLAKAKIAATTTTSEFENGLQISGTLEDFSMNENEDIEYIHYKGPLQLSINNKEIENRPSETLASYMMSPLGKILKVSADNIEVNIQSDKDWEQYTGKTLEIVYQEITASGILASTQIDSQGRVLFLELANMKLKRGEQHLSETMPRSFVILAEKVVSVFGNAADRARYLEVSGEEEYNSNNHVSNLTPETEEIISLYQKVRDFRSSQSNDFSQLNDTVELLQTKYPKEWLLRWELLEVASQATVKPNWAKLIMEELILLKNESNDIEEMINRGFNFLKSRSEN
jgi:phenylalanine-4-hydroxylase